MNKMRMYALLLIILVSHSVSSQTDTTLTDRLRHPTVPSISTSRNRNFSVEGTISITYEHYDLNKNPATYPGFRQRRPWNQVRFNCMPTFKYGKNFTMPTNFSFPVFPTNIAGPYAGIGKQSFKQWLVNPANNFGFNPTYKWAQLQLGTQYLNYSDLSTGDVGIFGAGFDLKPKGYLIKFFIGNSQQGINYIAPPPNPGTIGAFQRTHYMFQLGKEVEGKYLFALNFAKGKDIINSVVTPPITVKAQEGFVMSFVGSYNLKKGLYVKGEVARSYFTKDITLPLSPNSETSFKPFITGKTSTQTDFAGNLTFGRKTQNLDLGYTTKYIGSGFQTTGYPYMSPDHWDNTINTRFNTWKKKINVVGSVGVRINNLSNTALRSQILIANVNWLTQFNDHYSLNLSYNNFGFTTSSGTNPFGVKNVSNDLGISPTFTFSNTKMMHLLILSYNYSKYDERDVVTAIITSNNTHTILLSYNPVFFKKDMTPEFSAMYFNNSMPLVNISLLNLTAGIGMPIYKKRINLRAQLQYTYGKLNSYTGNHNLSPSLNIDCKVNKKLKWITFISFNHQKYGNELTPQPLLNGASYQEFFLRTTLQYNFSIK